MMFSIAADQLGCLQLSDIPILYSACRKRLRTKSQHHATMMMVRMLCDTAITGMGLQDSFM